MPKIISLQQNLVQVSIALNIFRLSIAMIGVFIPLIILKSGAPLWIVAAFYVCYAAVKLVLNYPITRLIQKVGAHIGLGWGFAAIALQLISILGFSWNGNYIFLGLSATALAIGNAFVWNSQHVHISQVMDGATKSSSIASMEIIWQLIDVVGPLLGGLIGFVFGPIGLLTASLLMLAISVVPLRKMGALKINTTDPLRYSLAGAPARDLFANFCFNIETTIGLMLWPIYLAVVLKTYESIGAIAALAAAATIGAVWIAGRQGDKGRDRQVLVQGAAISSVSHIMRIFAVTPLTIAGVSMVYKSSLAYLGNAWTSTYYAHAKRRGLQYIMSMEIVCDLAYLFLWSFLLCVLLVSGNVAVFFGSAFMIAAIAAWGCLSISRQGALVLNDEPA